MEERLHRLINANREGYRTSWARAWKGHGGKVIGLLSSYVPEEVVYAAGALPWRVTGAWSGVPDLAIKHRPRGTVLYYTHVLQSFLAGELDFLDGLIATDCEQDEVRLWDVCSSLSSIAFAHIIHVPHQRSPLGCQMLAREIAGLAEALGQFSGVRVEHRALHEAIDEADRTRMLLGKVYELRKQDCPPLSGAEMLGLTTAATVMSAAEFNSELEALIPFLERRRTHVDHVRPRLLLSSDMLDNPAYVDLIERAGCLVAMDDLDTGSRRFWGTVEGGAGDPFLALAEYHLSKPACPGIASWDEQTAQVIRWVREFRIDAVIELADRYQYSRRFRTPYLSKRTAEEGIPFISVARCYRLSDAETLTTVAGEFLAQIGNRGPATRN